MASLHRVQPLPWTQHKHVLEASASAKKKREGAQFFKVSDKKTWYNSGTISEAPKRHGAGARHGRTPRQVRTRCSSLDLLRVKVGVIRISLADASLQGHQEGATLAKRAQETPGKLLSWSDGGRNSLWRGLLNTM
ncbi:hypothetical protein NL676_034542 [Syzygium grande]|nr:hypothetical protein NL676_034542 [Syzygium grande]